MRRADAVIAGARFWFEGILAVASSTPEVTATCRAQPHRCQLTSSQLQNGKSFDAIRFQRNGLVRRYSDVRLADYVDPQGVARQCSGNVIADLRASGCFWALKKNPHEMGSKKGNVKIRRNVRRPEVIETIGSSGWTRTSNPPVNRYGSF